MNFDLLWPVLNKNTSIDLERIKESELEEIKNISFSSRTIKNDHYLENGKIILEEARRLYDQEMTRRGTADNKAGIYIATVTALLSILVSLSPSIISNSQNTPTKLINIFILLIAVLNLIRAGIWANKTLATSSFFLLDWKDLVLCYRKKDSVNDLTKNILLALRKNYDQTNNKVTYINMAHALMISSSFWLIISLIFNLTLQAFLSIKSIIISSTFYNQIYELQEIFSVTLLVIIKAAKSLFNFIC